MTGVFGKKKREGGTVYIGGRTAPTTGGSYTKNVTTTRCDSLHRRSLGDRWVPSIVRALSCGRATDIEEICIGVLITASGLVVLAHQGGQIEIGAVGCGAFARGRAR